MPANDHDQHLALMMRQLLDDEMYDLCLKSEEDGSCSFEFTLTEKGQGRSVEQQQTDLTVFRAFCNTLSKSLHHDDAPFGDMTLREWLDRSAHKTMWIVPDTTLRKPAKIELPPAYRIDHLIQFLVSKDTYRRVFSQTIIDLRLDYIAAIDAGNARRARIVLLRCYWSLVRDWFAVLPSSLVASIMKRLSGT